MKSLDEFRREYLEDIAYNEDEHPVEVFIDDAIDILVNDYKLIEDMQQCFFRNDSGNKKYKKFAIDAGYLEYNSNTINLLVADYNDGEVANLTNDYIDKKCRLLVNYIEATFKGFFDQGEISNSPVALALEMRNHIKEFGKINLFLISTNKLSGNVKTLPKYQVQCGFYTLEAKSFVLDIEKIYQARLQNGSSENLVINCSDYGIEGLPCLKAEIETEQYDSYLAIVPGDFLATIYNQYGPRLLESNVRSFLKFNGMANKGIRGTILNDKSKFFTYNNGIATTASSIDLDRNGDGTWIKSLTNLQIINGGQTTAILANTKIKNKADLSGIYVQMKLTVLKEQNYELISNIARYANTQNKVKTADLNSSHGFYVLIENFSRKIYAPLTAGDPVSKLWFFERTRGQYEQPLMKMTLAESKKYKLINPRKMKFTLIDLCKYENASNLLPYDVAWGGEVNAAHFHEKMIKQWDKDKNVFNEFFYKELIGKKILFDHIGILISAQEWYQQKKAYRPQLIAYTFSKLVAMAKQCNKNINFKRIWDKQSVDPALDDDLIRISKLVFDLVYNNKLNIANKETLCKKKEFWEIVSAECCSLTSNADVLLISEKDRMVEQAQAKKEQRSTNGLQNEIDIFNKGTGYWKLLIAKGIEQGIISKSEENILMNAVYYCEMKYLQLSKKQLKDINIVVDKLKESGIE